MISGTSDPYVAPGSTSPLQHPKISPKFPPQVAMMSGVDKGKIPKISG